MATLTPTATTLHSGLTRLLAWVTANPHIPLAYIHYADDCGVELCSPAGHHEAITAAADIADALTDPVITVDDPTGKRTTYLTIHGTLTDDYPEPLDITTEIRVYNGARTALLVSLGAPSLPTARHWTTTATHLRAITNP